MGDMGDMGDMEGMEGMEGMEDMGDMEDVEGMDGGLMSEEDFSTENLTNRQLVNLVKIYGELFRVERNAFNEHIVIHQGTRYISYKTF